MSFSKDIKDELCQSAIGNNNTMNAELEAMLRMSSEIVLNSNGITVSFQSTNPLVSKRFLTLLKGFISCDVQIITKKLNKLNQSNLYYANVCDMSDALIEEFGLLSDSKNRDEIMSDDEKKASYLRGAFLAKGSVNDPIKSNYHLEMYTSNDNDAIFIQQLMNSYNLNAKIAKRRDDLVIYLKELDAIKDFLRIIGVSNGVFTIEELQIQRSVSSSITRQMNIEGANDQKTLNAANEQIKYIRYLEYNYPLEKLDGKLLLIMKVRKQNQEASLNELIDILKDEYGEIITKSGLNHRFRKIKEIAIAFEEAKAHK